MPVRLNTSFGIPRFVLGGTTPIQQGATGFGVPLNTLGGLGLANQFGISPLAGLGGQNLTGLGGLNLSGLGGQNLAGLGGLNLSALSGFGLPLTNSNLLASLLLAQASGKQVGVVQTTDGGISGTKFFV